MVARRRGICSRALWVGTTASVVRAGTQPLRDMEVPGAGVQKGRRASGGGRLAAACRDDGCARGVTGAAGDGEAGQLGSRGAWPQSVAPGPGASSLRQPLRGLDAAARLLRAPKANPGELALRTPGREPRLALGRAPARWLDGPGMARVAQPPRVTDVSASAGWEPGWRAGAWAGAGPPPGFCTSAASRLRGGASRPRRTSSRCRSGTRTRSGTSRSPRAPPPAAT